MTRDHLICPNCERPVHSRQLIAVIGSPTGTYYECVYCGVTSAEGDWSVDDE